MIMEHIHKRYDKSNKIVHKKIKMKLKILKIAKTRILLLLFYKTDSIITLSENDSGKKATNTGTETKTFRSAYKNKKLGWRFYFTEKTICLYRFMKERADVKRRPNKDTFRMCDQRYDRPKRQAVLRRDDHQIH